MMSNPTFKKYESSVTDLQQFGVQDINAWYEAQTEYRCSAQDIVMSIASDVQHLIGEVEYEQNVRMMLNRLKWVTMNKLDNR